MKKYLIVLIMFLSAGLIYSAQIQRGTKSSGGTEFGSSEPIYAPEFNYDFDTIYNDYNGNITDYNISLSANINKYKLNGYPFTYVDLSPYTLYDTQISPNANIQGSKVIGVAHLIGGDIFTGIEHFFVGSDLSSSNTSVYIYSNQIVPKSYVDWKVSQAGAGSGAWLGSYPAVTADIGTGAVTGTNIASATITASNIANATITGAKLANATVTDTQMANMNGSKLIAGSVPYSALTLTNSILGTDINSSANIPKTVLSGYPFGTSDYSDNSVTDTKIISVSGSKITDNSITDIKLALKKLDFVIVSPSNLPTNSGTGIQSFPVFQNTSGASYTFTNITVLSDGTNAETFAFQGSNTATDMTTGETVLSSTATTSSGTECRYSTTTSGFTTGTLPNNTWLIFDHISGSPNYVTIHIEGYY